MEDNCREVLDFCRQGKETAGHFIVFRGAPGAGKTVLLSHFKEIWNGKPKCPQVLKIGLDTLEDTAATALEIVKKIAPEKAELFRRRLVGWSVHFQGNRTREHFLLRLEGIDAPQDWRNRSAFWWTRSRRSRKNTETASGNSIWGNTACRPSWLAPDWPILPGKCNKPCRCA